MECHLETLALEHMQATPNYLVHIELAPVKSTWSINPRILEIENNGNGD